MRSEVAGRSEAMTVVHVRAERFVALERSLVHAKGAKSPSREPTDSAQHTASSKARTPMHFHPDDLTGACINAALRIHRKFRSGMLENAYETFLFRTLVRDRFTVERQKRSPSSPREIAMTTPSART